MISKYYLFFVAVLIAKAEIVSFSKEVLSRVYQQNQIYIIYVHGSSHNFQAESVFNSHCFGQKPCAILQPNNADYDELLQFIGCEQEQFFLIFDPASQRKYITPISSHFTQNDLLSFEYKFTYKELQPYFASEPIPEENHHQCSKVVGKNMGEFLRRQERVKVILLYHLNEHCANCDQILKNFIPFAQRNYQPKKLTFGYFNTFLNDNPVVQDQKAPSYLIYIDKQFDHPFQIDSADLTELEYFLSKTMKTFGQEAPEKQKEQPQEVDGEL